MPEDPAAAGEDEHPVAHRARVLAEGAAAWERLRALLEAESGRANLHDASATAWSSREIYAHFARYQSHSMAQLHRIIAGGEPAPESDEDESAVNERWAAEDRALTLDEARDWCDTTTRALRELCLALTPETWQRWGRYYGDDVLAPHYLSHIRYIESGGREGG